MTLAFVVGIVGYLVGMLHGRRLAKGGAVRRSMPEFSALYVDPRCLKRFTIDDAQQVARHDPELDRMIVTAIRRDRTDRELREQVIVTTQYNAHPPVS